MKTNCKNYVEDPCVCDDFGEPKGQCMSCGYKWYEHGEVVISPEPITTECSLAMEGDHVVRQRIECHINLRIYR